MFVKIASLAATAALLTVGAAHADGTLNVATGGSQNMVDYVTDYLGPLFEEQNPGWTVSVVGTGPGDAGSQAIMEKLKAQESSDKWDLDVVVTAQLQTGKMVEDGLLQKYVADIATGKMATRDTSKMSLGMNVEGFVMPMFHSQTAIAYNPDLVKNPPKSFDEIKAWAEANKGAFGYNGIKNGMSGVAFTAAWMYAYAGDREQLMNGPYDAARKSAPAWDKALADLKAFNAFVTFTPGNAGTLDMMNRGEIAMGPVWVDMFYSWQADGRLNPALKLFLPEPGMPGQPYYYAIPAKATNADMARKFIELATSPKVQAEGIVKRFNWYPGIDAGNLKDALSADDWNKLFSDITPDELASKGLPFPLGSYFAEINEAYEAKVAN
nr:extracellular solute-binding protein [uncultured Cohaesibacter sp.]